MSAGFNVHFAIIGVPLIATSFIAWQGFAWFQKTRKGFAGVV
jgi:lipopolysaccharide transport system permease protein